MRGPAWLAAPPPSAGAPRSPPGWTGSAPGAAGSWPPTTSGAWSRHQVITDPGHKTAAAAMRRQRVGMLRPAGPEPEVEQRSLSVYDALGGGDGEGAA
jgi:hypothetical protein